MVGVDKPVWGIRAYVNLCSPMSAVWSGALLDLNLSQHTHAQVAQLFTKTIIRQLVCMFMNSSVSRILLVAQMGAKHCHPLVYHATM